MATWHKESTWLLQEQDQKPRALLLASWSPYGERKHSMEEFKDFCSGGCICGRNVPGGNLRCSELRDFGLFAKEEQAPAEPHGSGMHTKVSPICAVGAPGPPWSHKEQCPSRFGVSGASEALQGAAPMGPGRAGHGERLLGVPDTCFKTQTNPKPAWFWCSAISAAAGQLTSQGPASAAIGLQEGQGLAPAFENPSRSVCWDLLGQGQVGLLRREVSTPLGHRVLPSLTAQVPMVQHMDNTHSIRFCLSARSFPCFWPHKNQGEGDGVPRHGSVGCTQEPAPHTAVSCCALDSSFFLFILQKPWSPQKQAKVNWGITWSRRRGLGAPLAAWHPLHGKTPG